MCVVILDINACLSCHTLPQEEQGSRKGDGTARALEIVWHGAQTKSGWISATKEAEKAGKDCESSGGTKKTRRRLCF